MYEFSLDLRRLRRQCNPQPVQVWPIKKKVKVKPRNPKPPAISHSHAQSSIAYISFHRNIIPSHPRHRSTRPSASVSGLALECLLRVGGLLGKLHESHFGSILLCVVDELTIIPVASSYVPVLDGNGARPGSATS
jgi:hypothetical protein